ncbi:MAG: FHA domain-containing protein [Myxococcota bacterium]
MGAGWRWPLRAHVTAGTGATPTLTNSGSSGSVVPADESSRYSGGMMLERVETGDFALLPAIAVVGRDPRCDLVLESEHTSTRHAELRWLADGWDLRDLGSSNGTSMDGGRVEPGTAVRPKVGSVLQFAVPAERWKVADLGAPQPCLFDRRTGVRETAVADRMGELVYDLDAERWTLNGVPVAHGDPVGARVAFLPARSVAVQTVPSRIHLDSARLRLVASPDLVRIDVHLEGETERVSFVERSWAIALYVLAQARVSDPDEGWLDIERLARRTGLGRKVLDVYLIRAREALVLAGVADGERIIEVRRGGRRLGVRDVRVDHGEP